MCWHTRSWYPSSVIVGNTVLSSTYCELRNTLLYPGLLHVIHVISLYEQRCCREDDQGAAEHVEGVRTGAAGGREFDAGVIGNSVIHNCICRRRFNRSMCQICCFIFRILMLSGNLSGRISRSVLFPESFSVWDLNCSCPGMFARSGSGPHAMFPGGSQ